MVLNPEVQAKAQAEIDRVLENERLPEFSDQDSLPYVTAVMKEVLRYVHIFFYFAYAYSLVSLHSYSTIFDPVTVDWKWMVCDHQMATSQPAG